jgi:hypothetical protein
MRTRLRAKLAAAAVVAIIAGASFALFAPSGPAVAFSSGGLFLDVQVESPAQVVARGAAVDVTLEVTCNSPEAFVQVTVTQRSGSGVAQGSGSESVGCTGSGQQVVIRVQTFGAKVFKQGTAVASASIFGCTANFSTCGSETDSEVIQLQK